MKTRTFDFKDWKDAFACYYEEQAKDSSVRMVISTHFYSSGYWVENNTAELNPETDYAYETLKEVKELEKRVIKTRKKHRVWKEYDQKYHDVISIPLVI